MIFQHTHEWIFAPSPHTGQPKTQTSRIVKPGDSFAYKRPNGAIGCVYADSNLGFTAQGYEIDYVFDAKNHIRWQVGKTYAVQPGRGQKSNGRILVKRIQRRDILTITRMFARFEGFYDETMFWDTWVWMHDRSWYEAFAYANDCDYLREYGFFDRPPKRYDAWVLTFKPVHDDPR